MKPILKYIHTHTGGELEEFDPEIFDNFWCTVILVLGLMEKREGMITL